MQRECKDPALILANSSSGRCMACAGSVCCHSYVWGGREEAFASEAKRDEMLQKVAFESANLLKMSLVMAAALLAICLVALVEATNTAEATSLLENGKIAFGSAGGDAGGIYTMDPDGSSLSLLTNDTYAGPEPDWSPNGRKIALGGGHIHVIDADGSNLRVLTADRGEFANHDPTWSPDGTQLAFSSQGPPHNISDIYTMDADGSNLTNLTNSPEVSELSPDFSPDGSQMCLYRADMGPGPRPAAGIYVMNADGSNPTRLTDNRAGLECDWSQDGTKIAYTYHPVPGKGVTWPDEVYAMNADGSGKTNLTSNPAWDSSPGWSPDGTKITFASDRDGDYDIYTMDADGSDVTQVTTNSGAKDLDPDWQPLLRPPKSRSETVHPPDTGGTSLLLVASALLLAVGRLLYAGVRRRM